MVRSRAVRPPGRIILAAALGTALIVMASDSLRGNPAEYWPHWRGPLASGSAPAGDPPAVLWTQTRNTPFVSSPLLHRGVIHTLRENSSLLTAFDARTGEPHYSERIDGLFNVYASPVGVGSRIYVVGREGTTAVVRHGAGYELLAANTLDDAFDASPAVAGSDLFLRGQQHLYRISE